MFQSLWKRFVSGQSSRRMNRAIRCNKALRLEALEDRLAPAAPISGTVSVHAMRRRRRMQPPSPCKQ